MTNILFSLPDDLTHGLHSLDFSTLLSYPAQDHIFPSAVSPTALQNHPIFSPPRSAHGRRGRASPADPYPDPASWVTNLSPLFGQSDSDTDLSSLFFTNNGKINDTSLWGSTVTAAASSQEPLFNLCSMNIDCPSLPSNYLNSGHPVPLPEKAVYTSIDSAESAQNIATRMENPVEKVEIREAATREISLTKREEDREYSMNDEPTQYSEQAFLSKSAKTEVLSGDEEQSCSSRGDSGSDADQGGSKGVKKTCASTQKVARTMSSIDKAAERRRKNRESSSRCYYNRKRIIGTLDRQISAEKTRLTALYDRALELRHENAKLKKDVVTGGIALPTKQGMAGGAEAATISIHEYLHLLQSGSIQTRQ